VPKYQNALFKFYPPVTPEEIRAASLQFVRKISGFNKPSKANENSFLSAVDVDSLQSLRVLFIHLNNRTAQAPGTRRSRKKPECGIWRRFSN